VQSAPQRFTPTIVLVIIALVPLLLGAANLTWDEVTSDVEGNAEVIATYRIYNRIFNSLDQFFVLAETEGCVPAPTEAGRCIFDLPTASAKQEYVCTAVDAAGNESVFSNIATAFPDAPGQLKVNKGSP